MPSLKNKRKPGLRAKSKKTSLRKTKKSMNKKTNRRGRRVQAGGMNEEKIKSHINYPEEIKNQQNQFYKNLDELRYVFFNSLHLLKDGELKINLEDAEILIGCGFNQKKILEENFGTFQKDANEKNTGGQNILGFMYANGEGVEKNESTAVEWYLKAAEQGNANGQFNLGIMYANGEGVEKNESTAVEWYRKAAEQGNANGQFNLGVMTANGQGVQQSFSEALPLLQKAKAQGHEMATDAIQKIQKMQREQQAAALTPSLITTTVVNVTKEKIIDAKVLKGPEISNLTKIQLEERIKEMSNYDSSSDNGLETKSYLQKILDYLKLFKKNEEDERCPKPK